VISKLRLEEKEREAKTDRNTQACRVGPVDNMKRNMNSVKEIGGMKAVTTSVPCDETAKQTTNHPVS
jgi:hypothetical protein